MNTNLLRFCLFRIGSAKLNMVVALLLVFGIWYLGIYPDFTFDQSGYIENVNFGESQPSGVFYPGLLINLYFVLLVASVFAVKDLFQLLTDSFEIALVLTKALTRLQLVISIVLSSGIYLAFINLLFFCGLFLAIYIQYGVINTGFLFAAMVSIMWSFLASVLLVIFSFIGKSSTAGVFYFLGYLYVLPYGIDIFVQSIKANQEITQFMDAFFGYFLFSMTALLNQVFIMPFEWSFSYFILFNAFVLVMAVVWYFNHTLKKVDF